MYCDAKNNKEAVKQVIRIYKLQIWSLDKLEKKTAKMKSAIHP